MQQTRPVHTINGEEGATLAYRKTHQRVEWVECHVGQHDFDMISLAPWNRSGDEVILLPLTRRESRRQCR